MAPVEKVIIDFTSNLWCQPKKWNHGWYLTTMKIITATNIIESIISMLFFRFFPWNYFTIFIQVYGI